MLFVFCWKPREDSKTPLYVASQLGRHDVVCLLAEAGTDQDQAQNHGTPPLRIASQQGCLDVVRFLTEGSADKDCAVKPGRTSLFTAFQNGHLAGSWR